MEFLSSLALLLDGVLLQAYHLLFCTHCLSVPFVGLVSIWIVTVSLISL